MTCRRRDESSSLLLQVNEPFNDSPQLFPTSQSSCKDFIWARPYWEHPQLDAGGYYYVLHLYQVVIVTLNYGKSVEVRETRMT